MSDSVRATVLGVGNPLMGDDGLGLAALERLRERWGDDGDVEFVDGGTWGMSLLPVIEAADRLLLLDAIDLGWVPGSLVLLDRSHLPAGLGTKVSPHQVDLRDVMALAMLRDALPAELAAVGLQPQSVDFGCGLSPVIAARIDALVRVAEGRLQRWGCRPRRTLEPVRA